MKIQVQKLTEEEIESRGIRNWPVWTKEISTFDWYYDEQEQCLFLEGDVIVKTGDGEVRVGKGDFVIFPKGLNCIWDVKKPVRKHYNFG